MGKGADLLASEYEPIYRISEAEKNLTKYLSPESVREVIRSLGYMLTDYYRYKHYIPTVRKLHARAEAINDAFRLTTFIREKIKSSKELKNTLVKKSNLTTKTLFKFFENPNLMLMMLQFLQPQDFGTASRVNTKWHGFFYNAPLQRPYYNGLIPTIENKVPKNILKQLPEGYFFVRLSEHKGIVISTEKTNLTAISYQDLLPAVQAAERFKQLDHPPSGCCVIM